MTIHPHQEVPRPPTPEHSKLGGPVTALAIGVMLSIGIIVYAFPLRHAPTVEPMTTGQGGPVAIAPIIDPASTAQ